MGQKELNFFLIFYFISFKTIGAVPVAHVDQLTPEKLGTAKLIEEVTLSDDSKVLKVTGVNPNAKTVTLLIRGSNNLVILIFFLNEFNI